MNVLPFVFAVFAIFTFLSNSLLKDTKETNILINRIENFYQLQQKHFNGVAGLSYKALTTQRQETQFNSPIKPSKVEYKSPRFSEALKGAQLNLYPLIQEKEAKNHPFYPIVVNLLCSLYPTILSDQQAGSNLLDALFAKAKTLKEPSLNELMPEDPLLQEKYYKMIRGTNQYDIKQKKGIPPLADFLMIYKTKEACCYLCSAHFFVLQAIFGEEFTNKIIAGEKQKWENERTKLFNKKELESLIMEYPTEAAIYETIKKYCRAQLTKKKISKKTQSGMSFRKES